MQLERSGLVGMGMLLLGISACAGEADKGVPKLVEKLSVDGAKIKPFTIGAEELRSFVRVVEGKDFRSIVEAGKEIFRPYARLPEGFDELLSRYRKGRFTGVARYTFLEDKENMARAQVHARTGMVESFWLREKNVTRRPLDLPDDTTALKLARNYLEAKGWDIGRCGVRLAFFGKKTRFIYVSEKGRGRGIPVSPALFIMNPTGEIRGKTLEGLGWAVDREFPRSVKQHSPDKVIKSFVDLWAGGKIVAGKGDIPGYAKQPLDEDIDKAVRAPFQFWDPKGNRIHVVYTYGQIGGIIRRYRFVFEKGHYLRTPRCALLGWDIGEAEYYE